MQKIRGSIRRNWSAPDLRPICCRCPGNISAQPTARSLPLARLTATEAPKFEDNETTIAELRERIAKTEAYLATISPEALEGTETNEVTIAPGGNKTTFRGDEYVATFALPNFYFHVAMAHAILRNQGAPVGKMDYLGRFA